MHPYITNPETTKCDAKERGGLAAWKGPKIKKIKK